VADEFVDGFLADYFAECEEHLTAAWTTLLALDASPDRSPEQRQSVDALFRNFHSLKGLSAMVELRPAEQLAHEIESFLRAVRDGEVALTTDGVTVLIDGTQRLEHVINARRIGGPVSPISDITARLESLHGSARAAASRPGGDATPARAPAAGPSQTWTCTFAPTRELLAHGVGVDWMRKRLSEVGTIVEAAPLVRPDGSIAFVFTLRTPTDVDAIAALERDAVTVQPIEAPLPDMAPRLPPDDGDPGGSQASLTGSHVVRVDLTRLDELMRTVGDLVISRARLFDSLSRIEPFAPPIEWRLVQENALTIDRQLRTLREGLMRVRLVPVGEIFRRMPFVVRDLARETRKKVTLLKQAQTTEIDKYLIERMMDPVLHLVRNAVSHGIEPPDERITRGKRPEGTITLTASAAGELVTIEIADDGRGVDGAEVAERARHAGLDVPAGPLDSHALLALLCAPGFSTKEAADRASGRGVGMAVVKETVERLSGTLAMASEPGRGTRFTVQLPLTLAIADALIGRVGAEAFAMPQSAVREVLGVDAADVRQIEGHEIVPFRDAALPILRLSRLFGIAADPRDRFHVFVVGAGAAMLGLAVDRIEGQREIVVRAIADPLIRVDGIAGATDLGDGRVVLILDAASIVRLNSERQGRTLEAASGWGRLRA